MNLADRLLQPAIHAGWRWLQRRGDVGPGSAAARRFGSFGAKSCLGFPYATVMNEYAIHIGEHTLIGRHVTLSFGYGPLPRPRDARLIEGGAPEGLWVGDRCVIGARCTLTAHTTIRLGHDVWLGQDVFISDASHGYQNPDVPIGDQLGEHQPVSIGDGSWIGHGAIVLPGTQIGRNVVVGGGSVVRGTVPDYAVVAGVPASVVRRYEPGVGWLNQRGDDVRPVSDVPWPAG